MDVVKDRYTKQQIADAVHQAVCAHTGTDGFGSCMRYAWCGAAVLARLGYAYPMVQVGGLRIHADPGDPTLCLEMDPSQGLANEYHAWIGMYKKAPPPGMRLVGGAHQVVDFAARHYRNYVERLNYVPGTETVAWKHPEDPPDYLWGGRGELPDWVAFDAQLQATIRESKAFDYSEVPLMQRHALSILRAMPAGLPQQPTSEPHRQPFSAKGASPDRLKARRELAARLEARRRGGV